LHPPAGLHPFQTYRREMRHMLRAVSFLGPAESADRIKFTGAWEFGAEGKHPFLNLFVFSDRPSVLHVRP